jgi:hypothetical protein
MFQSEPALEEAVSDNAQSSGHNDGADRSRQTDAEQNVTRRRLIIIQCWIVIFFLGIWLLGFKVGAFLLTFGFLRLAAHEPWGISTAFAVVSYLFFLIVFDFALQVPLGTGLIAESLELNSLDTYLVRPFINVLTR